MNIKSWVRLPWKIKDVVRSMRRDLADSRLTIAELSRMISTMELRQEERTEELRQCTEELRRRTEELKQSTEELRREIQEQGLLLETAARFPIRAEAERKLRSQLTPPTSREAGVSVLITCWNHAGVLGVALASAIATIDALPVPGEVLILDDASRDGSSLVAREFARGEQRIHVIASDENLGLPRARNVLLSQARFGHAMILDSDNQLVPSGVATLYESARQTGAVLTYGNIVMVDPSGSIQYVMSNERVTAKLLDANWIDAMALVKTERVLELGGYDCQWLYGLEDWELNQRLFRLGEPMAFVPVVVGKYTISPLSMLREAPTSLRFRRSWRIFGRGEASRSEQFRACVHHPVAGTIWASAGWSAQTAARATREVPHRAPSPPRILVVSSGGVRNYGDDAILLSTLQRLARIRPNCLASVVSDGADCPPLGRLGVWAGTCEEFCSGLNVADVTCGCRDRAALPAELARWLKFGSQSRADLSEFNMILFAGGGNLNSYWPALIAEGRPLPQPPMPRVYRTS